VIVRLGIIGLSPGNGHPFSFSAIINGYSDEGLRASGWDVIYKYVRRRDAAEIGLEGCTVTHVWTQDPETTRKLRQACFIPHEVGAPEEMIDEIDGVIIARDDYQHHLELAMPFLRAGKAVFVDKPLCIYQSELAELRPYLDSGRLVSCSAMRYAAELDEARANLAAYGDLLLVRGTILNDWRKYGIHMLDAIAGLRPIESEWIEATETGHMSVRMGGGGGPLLQVDALGEVAPVFQFDLFGTAASSTHAIRDNFTMFRRTMWHFCEAVSAGSPPFDPLETVMAMRILIAGERSRNEKRRVYLEEIDV
jgi:predicted dehydrogenase